MNIRFSDLAPFKNLKIFRVESKATFFCMAEKHHKNSCQYYCCNLNMTIISTSMTDRLCSPQ